jgi:hypothetical protein
MSIAYILLMISELNTMESEYYFVYQRNYNNSIIAKVL